MLKFITVLLTTVHLLLNIINKLVRNDDGSLLSNRVDFFSLLALISRFTRHTSNVHSKPSEAFEQSAKKRLPGCE